MCRFLHLAAYLGDYLGINVSLSEQLSKPYLSGCCYARISNGVLMQLKYRRLGSAHHNSAKQRSSVKIWKPFSLVPKLQLGNA
jgi:hypothetical protein